MTSLTYTGIGSRSTPVDIMNEMTRIGTILEQNEFVLNSGGAEGADTAFASGIHDMMNTQIFTPWPGFCLADWAIPLDDLDSKLVIKAEEIASRYHPAWHRCSPAAKKLHTRNAFQVLGLDLKTPVDFVLYWCRIIDDKPTGGTSQALRIARANSISTYLVGSPEYLQFISSSNFEESI